MRLLASEGPLAMEAVAVRLCLPRSSTFRLLETLRALGHAERDSARRYRLTWSFRPDESGAFVPRLSAAMRQLAESLGVTIEWYEPSARGMELRLQQLPSRAEVLVQARPGFVREWNTEFDAVARLGHALVPSAPALQAGIHHFARDGQRTRLPLRDARTLLVAAREHESASDTTFNSFGVRRAAVAVRLPGNVFAGLLVAASSLTFSPKAPTPAQLVSALRGAGVTIAH
jgi:DNA-binding IclR family transcriptional regulator